MPKDLLLVDTLNVTLQVGVVGEGLGALGAQVHVVLLLVRVIVEMLPKACLLLQPVGLPALFAGKSLTVLVQIFRLQLSVRGGVLPQARTTAANIGEADGDLLQLADVVLLDVSPVGAEVTGAHDLVANQAN